LAGFIILVGTNTFPNFVPILNGYSEEDFIKICYPTRWTKLDDCPFIWKRFDEANYLTGLTEDAPWLAIFDYAKTGFVKQPVDFYSRPFWSAACQNSGLTVLKKVSKIVGLSIQVKLCSWCKTRQDNRLSNSAHDNLYLCCF
jgi:hypothetical protein